MKTVTLTTLIFVEAAIVIMTIIRLHDNIALHYIIEDNNPLEIVVIALLLMLSVAYIAKHGDKAYDFSYPHSEDTAFTNELEYQ